VTGSRIRVGILGPLRVNTAEGELHIGAPKQRLLLAVLAIHRGHSVGAERLIDYLWSDDPPRSAAKTLQTYISGLRRLLPADTLRTVPGGYELDLAPEDYDADVFEQCLRSARLARETGKGADAKELLEQGLALWRGPALGDLASEGHGLTAGQRLDELRRVALEDLHGVRMEAGGDGELVADLEAAVSEEPLRERRWAQLMTTLYRCGRQADALRAYRRLQETLGSELGLEPSPELVQLEQAILLQDPALSVPVPGDGRGRSLLVASLTSIPTLKQTEPVSIDFSLQHRHLTIGRQEGNDVLLTLDMLVSRHHAEIEERGGEWILRDLRSRNGTILNGRRITESILRNGDKIKVGSAVFDFAVERDSMATMTGTRAPECR
jgi:SARP family transcriptional regulator, regulator of embCAB operon